MPNVPFNVRNLSVLAYANGFTLWHFKAEKTDPISSPQFWNPAADLLGHGDHIHVGGEKTAILSVERNAAEITRIVILGTPQE